MWVSGIISLLTTLPFMFIIVYVGQSFPGKTIIQYIPDLLGKIPGKLLGFVLCAYFFIVSTNSVSMYIHHLTDFLLPQTPFLVVTVLHVLIISFFIWKGPEVIARTGVIGFALSLVFYLLVFLASVSEINLDRILPVFDSGVIPVLASSIKADSFVGVLPILVTMILPMVSNQKKVLSSAVSGLFIGSFLFIFYFVSELMVMGPNVVALMRIASMDFVRSIQITQYLHRFESFMVALWYWSILVQAAILSSCSIQAFMQTTGMKKKTPVLIIIYGIAMATLTYLLAYNRVLFLHIRENIWQYFAIPIQYGLPILVLLALMVRKIAAK